MDLESIVARLKAQAPILRSVGGTATLDAAAKGNRPMEPCAFVLPGAFTAAENELGANGFSQLVRQQFSVVLCVKNVADAQGASAHGDLKPVLVQVEAALLNWQPPWAANPIELQAGDLADMEPGLLWWEHKFRVEFYK